VSRETDRHCESSAGNRQTLVTKASEFFGENGRFQPPYGWSQYTSARDSQEAATEVYWTRVSTRLG